MPIRWFLCASLSVAGSLAYNVGMRMGTAATNVFAFMLVLSGTVFLIQSFVFMIAKYAFKIDTAQGVNLQNMKYAVMTGAAAALIDISYFFALRYGSVIASQIFWTVGGMIALAVFAVFFLGETMTLSKTLGIVFGIMAVLLMSKQS